MELLELKNIGLIYQADESETIALEDVNFSVKNGEFISIVGPSGCGKTTILSLIAGLITPTSGEILLNGKAVQKPSSDIGYMLQRDQLFEWRNILSNVTLGLEIQKIKNQDNVEYTVQLLEKYGLGDFKKHFPNQLSGGMRQRVALIRTLAFRPQLLLLDEPFSALDFQTRLDVQEDIHNIIKNEGKTALLVTHDISEAIALSDRVIILSNRPGKVKKILEISFDNFTPSQKRKTTMFPSLFDQIWREVTNEKNSH